MVMMKMIIHNSKQHHKKPNRFFLSFACSLFHSARSIPTNGFCVSFLAFTRENSKYERFITTKNANNNKKKQLSISFKYGIPSLLIVVYFDFLIDIGKCKRKQWNKPRWKMKNANFFGFSTHTQRKTTRTDFMGKYLSFYRSRGCNALRTLLFFYLFVLLFQEL